MKFILLAAAAAVAMPALAQTGTMTPDTTAPAPQTDTMQTAPATPADTANPPGTTMQQPMPAPATSDGTMSTTTAPMAAPMASTMAPAGTGGMMGGAGVAPQPIGAATPVDPNPPVCRKGQFNGCRNGPQSTHSREVRGR